MEKDLLEKEAAVMEEGREEDFMVVKLSKPYRF